MRLFDITEQIELVLSQGLDETTGEISDETCKLLDELELARDEKVLAIAAYLKGERCEAEAVAAQAKKLAERAKRHHARADRLEAYIEANIPAGTKLRDDKAEIVWRKSSVVSITDENQVPLEYQRLKTEIDKAGIKAALQIGVPVPGAELKQKLNMSVK